MGSSAVVYLAGPITGQTYGEATDWRDEATEAAAQLGYTVYSPMRGKGELAAPYADQVIDPSVDANIGMTIFARDYHDVTRADVVLANLLSMGETGVSIGSIFELGVAYNRGAFIIIVLPKLQDCKPPLAGKLGWHPFIVGMTSTQGALVHSLEEAYNVLEALNPVGPARLQLGGPYAEAAEVFLRSMDGDLDNVGAGLDGD